MDRTTTVWKIFSSGRRSSWPVTVLPPPDRESAPDLLSVVSENNMEFKNVSRCTSSYNNNYNITKRERSDRNDIWLTDGGWGKKNKKMNKSKDENRIIVLWACATVTREYIIYLYTYTNDAVADTIVQW